MSDEFLVWFDREYPMDETGSRTKYKETCVMDLMRSAFEARRTVSGQEAQPIYQVISRGVCQDVTKEQYDTCEGKRYERRIVYAAPIPATELLNDIRGYLQCVVDSSMSRNNAMALASELIEQIDKRNQSESS